MRFVAAIRRLLGRFRARRSELDRSDALTSAEIAELSVIAEALSRILGPDAGFVTSQILIATSRLDRTRLVTAWATSSRAGLRTALAESFAHAFDAVGRGTAQRHLAQDPHPAVRMAVHRAALLRNTPDSQESIGPMLSWLVHE